MEKGIQIGCCDITKDNEPDGRGQILVHTRDLSDNPSESSETHTSSPTAVEKIGSFDDTTESLSTSHWIKEYLSILSKSSEGEHHHSLGVAYRNLKVYGLGNAFDYQPDVISVFQHGLDTLTGVFRRRARVTILHDFEGCVRRGEMCIVLGRPGSGVSTILKTIACQTLGLEIDENSKMNYQGHSQEMIQTRLRGEVVYQAERDIHFPHLTVGQTLSFASLASTPSSCLPNLSRWQYARHVRDIIMKIFGLAHAEHTKLGNDYVRGVSGGERKRVSIAEVTLRRCALQCWDNSTRGLDSATALHVIKTLRLATSLMGSTAFVSVYQASQDVYDTFDKVLLLYEGRQIFFGSKEAAKTYFTDMGFLCPERQTTADFLTALTNPSERLIQSGFDNRVPRTAEDFATVWRASNARQVLMKELNDFEKEFPPEGPQALRVSGSSRLLKCKPSPYAISTLMQISICTLRGLQRLRADIVAQVVSVVAAFVRALVIGSVFYNLPVTTGNFYERNTVLYFSLVFNSLTSSLDVLPLYDQRPVVEKHAAYAMYHPFAEAIATFICDLPNKVLCSLAFNIPIYLMSNLRREAGAIFTFMLIAFACTLAMSMIFRCIGQGTRSLAQGVTPLGLTTIASIVYGGFMLPKDMMQGWPRWISYVDPLSYAFESAMINEYRGRPYTCSQFVPLGPGYESAEGETRACQAAGAAAGADFVDGDAYLSVNFGFNSTHLWRNFGILIGFTIVFGFIYLVIAEFVLFRSSGEDMVLFHRRWTQIFRRKLRNDEEHQSDGGEKVTLSSSDSLKRSELPVEIQKQASIFHWTNVCYDITIKGERRRILDRVDGWVKPGTLTALMGATGAGKTSLLDVLAARTTVGVVSGDIMVNGTPRPGSFERRTGYIQQADLHLPTTTVREALTFSALLRQPATVPKDEKLAYVEEIMKVLEMEAYADAVVGEPGKGLNVEQRKRLSIGVELAAKPELLLFLDEPTSGLDTDTAWSIGSLIRKLADNGQAILCTIHQPSSTLFEIFDRILLLAKGGRTVYFGDIGSDAKIMTGYFERDGALPIKPDQNPAEWVLEVIGAAPGMDVSEDWAEIWSRSSEYAAVKEQLQQMHKDVSKAHTSDIVEYNQSARSFATRFRYQLLVCLKRAIVQYWRSPAYIWAKLGLCLATSIFIGLSFFQSPLSIQGLQSQMFSLFLLMIVFAFLMYQSMPKFLMQRDLYEARERPSKMYSWPAFMLTNIIVEIPWNTMAAVVIFFPLYYLIGMDKNATYTNAVAERGAGMFLLLWSYMVYCGTFTIMVTAAVRTAGIAAIISLLLFAFSLIFCGVIATPIALPGFWIFTYRLSPLTYLLTALLSTGIANAPVTCSATELVRLQPPTNISCGDYLASYVSYAGGYVANPAALLDCEFCPMSSTNVFLASVYSFYDERWRNFGILWAYVGFNIGVALVLYWLFRVPKQSGFWKRLWVRN